MLLVVSLEGVVACTVRAREQGRTGQNRFPRGTEGARLSEWCRELCGKSRSAWRMSSVGGTGRAVRVPRVIQSMAPKTKKEMSGIPSEWGGARLCAGWPRPADAEFAGRARRARAATHEQREYKQNQARNRSQLGWISHARPYYCDSRSLVP